MLHHGRLITSTVTSSSAATGCAAAPGSLIGADLESVKSSSTSDSILTSSASISSVDASMNNYSTSKSRSRSAYDDDLEPTFVCLTQFDRPLPSKNSVSSPTATTTTAIHLCPSVAGSSAAGTIKMRKPRPTSLPADSQPTLLKTLRSKLRPSTSHTSSSKEHKATTPLPSLTPIPSASTSRAVTPTSEHPPDPHTHLSPHTHALLLPTSQTLYGSSSPHPPPKHALQFIRHLVGASRGCAEALGMNSSLVLQDPERNACGDLGFWVGSVRQGWEGDGDDGVEDEGEDDEGLSQEMVIERLMLALGLRGWLMVANPMIFPSRLPLRLEELQSLLPPSMNANTRRPIKKLIGAVGKLEDACEVLLGEGERTGGMAPQFLIGKYRWFEEDGEGRKGRMRTSWCGLVSIRSEMRLEGKKWRPASHFSLEGRKATHRRSHSRTTSQSSIPPVPGAETGLRPSHSRTHSRSHSHSHIKSRTHSRTSSTTLVHALGHAHTPAPLDTSSSSLHAGLTAPRKGMALVPQRFEAGESLRRLISLHPLSLILVLMLCLVWEWAWLF